VNALLGLEARTVAVPDAAVEEAQIAAVADAPADIAEEAAHTAAADTAAGVRTAEGTAASHTVVAAHIAGAEGVAPVAVPVAPAMLAPVHIPVEPVATELFADRVTVAEEEPLPPVPQLLSPSLHKKGIQSSKAEHRVRTADKSN